MKKRYRKLLLTLALALLVPFSVIHDVKASQDYTIKDLTIATGYSYYAAANVTGTSWEDMLTFVVNDIANVGQYYSGWVHDIQFNNKYSGNLYIYFNGSISNAECIYVRGNNCRIISVNNSSNYVVVSMNSCSDLVVALLSESSNDISSCSLKSIGYSGLVVDNADETVVSNFDVKLSDMEDTLQDILTALSTGSSGGLIESWRYPAYQFPVNNGSIIVVNNDLGYQVTDGTYGTVTRIPAVTTEYFYFYSYDADITITEYNGSWNVSLEVVEDYQFYHYRLFKLTIENTSLTSSANRIIWNMPDGVTSDYIIPLYFGNGEDMTDEMISLTHHRSDSQASTDENENDLVDITDDIHLITDPIADDFFDYSQDINLDNYNIFSGLTETSTYFKTYLDDYFVNLGDFRAIIILPVIITIFVMMVGWMI